jgi:hypothetical protein
MVNDVNFTPLDLLGNLFGTVTEEGPARDESVRGATHLIGRELTYQ